MSFMLNEESIYPMDWLSIAERDLDGVRRCLRDSDTGAAGFFLQQSLEKFLKAFLLSRGWRLRRIHDLEALLDDAVEHNSTLEEFRPICQQVTGYYLIERYPLPEAIIPGETEVTTALGKVQELATKVKETISA